MLTDARFQQLAAVPAELEWFANLDNPRTRRAYQGDLKEFMAFVGIQAPEQFRGTTAGVPADVFAFCVTCWEALFGELPFAAPPPDMQLIHLPTGVTHRSAAFANRSIVTPVPPRRAPRSSSTAC